MKEVQLFLICYIGNFIVWIIDKIYPWHSEDKGQFRDTDRYNMMTAKEVKEMLREWEEANK